MRRVITGVNAQGKAVFTADEETPHAYHLGGVGMGELWFDPAAVISGGTDDLAATKMAAVPKPGEVLVRYVVFPPAGGAAPAAPNVAGVAPARIELVGEPDNPVHTTETVDYGFVLSGSITLELDDGARTVLNAGDAFVQNGTRHAWRNETNAPAVLGVVMLGAVRRP